MAADMAADMVADLELRVALRARRTGAGGDVETGEGPPGSRRSLVRDKCERTEAMSPRPLLSSVLHLGVDTDLDTLWRVGVGGRCFADVPVRIGRGQTRASSSFGALQRDIWTKRGTGPLQRAEWDSDLQTFTDFKAKKKNQGSFLNRKTDFKKRRLMLPGTGKWSKGTFCGSEIIITSILLEFKVAVATLEACVGGDVIGFPRRW